MSNYYRHFLLLIPFLSFCLYGFNQAPQITFAHLNTEDGLPDGTVKSVTQDKYGYIWVATQYGLCRYNGYTVTPYFHNNGDSNSLAGNFIWSVFKDQEGNIWIGNDRFLSVYKYGTNSFTNYACPFNAAVTKIVEDEQQQLWLASSAGLLQFQKKGGRFIHFRNSPDSLVKKACSVRLNDLFADKEKGILYLATHNGFKVFDYHKNTVLPPFLNVASDTYGINTSITTAVTKDKSGSVWFGSGFTNSILVKWDPSSNRIRYYKDLIDNGRGWKENRTLSLFTDKAGNVWAGGFTSSLSVYLPAKDAFYHYQNDALQQTSIAGTSITNIFQDDHGMIWVGSEGYGVDRFHPGNPLFTCFQQTATQPSLLHEWGRAGIEDSQGNLWFGTSGGISVYHTKDDTYKNYYNSEKSPALISFNTIRSFAEDKKGNVWIGTGNGLNRYDLASGKFQVYNERDSLKSYFVWALLASTNGDLYVGGTGGLQRYDYTKGKFLDVDNESLSKGTFHFNVRNLFEDANGGLWIGVYDGGLIYYHPKEKVFKHYLHDEKNFNSLSSNFVTSVVEDKKGLIWISTRDGLNSLDTKTQKFHTYTTNDQLPSNKTAALRVDAANRLWIGTGNGLSVLDQDTKVIVNFDRSDGLPTAEFNDQVAATTHDGKFIYPTYRGFVVFNPEAVQQRKSPRPQVHLSAFKVFNKPLPLDGHLEEIKKIELSYDQVFFSIELTGLNYENPEKVFYAYKLEPFNKDWIYTQDRNITYTSLPGGKYKFQYKATANPSDWDVEVHSIDINIGTVFYKTPWFILLLFLLIGSLLYAYYRLRLKQNSDVHRLQLQATRLEKDKTEIQYQNLINQFNPHFLFNSLTSLNSLIYENKELASDFLEQLSAVYRYLLTHKETQLVTLEAETSFIRHYVSLLKTRFENGLEVNIDIPGPLLQKKLVPVTFQLMIENAIKHNIIDESSPLIISITADGRYLNIANNLQKKSFVETSNRKGLESLKTLYKYLSALPFVIEQTETEFIIRVPLI